MKTTLIQQLVAVFLLCLVLAGMAQDEHQQHQEPEQRHHEPEQQNREPEQQYHREPEQQYQEPKHQEPEPLTHHDCTAECNQKVADAVHPLHIDKRALQEELNRVLEHDLKAAHASKEELQVQVAELSATVASAHRDADQLRRSLDQAREEAVKWHQKADESMRAMVDVRDQLAAAEATIARLKQDLEAANEKILELESISFVKQLQKELVILLEAFKMRWANLRDIFSGRDKDSDDL